MEFGRHAQLEHNFEKWCAFGIPPPKKSKFGFVLPKRFLGPEIVRIVPRKINQVMTTAKGHLAARGRSGPRLVSFGGATHLPVLMWAAASLSRPGRKHIYFLFPGQVT